MSGGQDCVVVLGRALPHIVPNVLLNKRDVSVVDAGDVW